MSPFDPTRSGHSASDAVLSSVPHALARSEIVVEQPHLESGSFALHRPVVRLVTLRKHASKAKINIATAENTCATKGRDRDTGTSSMTTADRDEADGEQIGTGILVSGSRQAVRHVGLPDGFVRRIVFDNVFGGSTAHT